MWLSETTRAAEGRRRRASGAARCSGVRQPALVRELGSTGGGLTAARVGLGSVGRANEMLGSGGSEEAMGCSRFAPAAASDADRGRASIGERRPDRRGTIGTNNERAT